MNAEVLLLQVDGAIAGVEALRVQLEGIRAQLAGALQPPACAHHQKDDLAGFGSGEHWICKDCGHEQKD